jgi:hypothetical protein
MMDAADVLVQTLDKEVTAKREWLASGQAKDYAEYQRICGEIKGLLFAKQEILDLKQKMEHSNE